MVYTTLSVKINIPLETKVIDKIFQELAATFILIKPDWDEIRYVRYDCHSMPKHVNTVYVRVKHKEGANIRFNEYVITNKIKSCIKHKDIYNYLNLDNKECKDFKDRDKHYNEDIIRIVYKMKTIAKLRDNFHAPITGIYLIKNKNIKV